jgi:gas vesicle protein
MTNDPEQIRADIEETRRELGGDVDALADKVRPSSIVHRQTERVKGAVGRARDAVMGTASDAASTVGDTVSDLPHKAAQTARGNPIAVGLIAFGFGLLAASLLPASAKERELAESAKDMASPAVDKLKEAAHTVADDMKEPAKEAAQSVKDAAKDAASNVKDAASSDSGGGGAHEASTPDIGQQPPPTTTGGFGVGGSSPTAPRDPLSGGTTGL